MGTPEVTASLGVVLQLTKALGILKLIRYPANAGDDNRTVLNTTT